MPNQPDSQAPQGNRADSGATIYDRMRGDLMEMSLRPSEKLRVASLVERYDASVGSLREAMTELRAEGFILSEAGKGFSVRPTASADLIDITELRIVLEGLALREAIAHGDDKWEADVVAALFLLGKVETGAPAGTHGPAADWEERHRHFHDTLLAACPSSWTLRFCGILADHNHRYRTFLRREWPGTRNPHAEHKAIADAALARDADRAVALLAEHYRKTTTAIVRRMDAGDA